MQRVKLEDLAVSSDSVMMFLAKLLAIDLVRVMFNWHFHLMMTYDCVVLFLFLKYDPEQKSVLLCYDQLWSVLELRLPTCLQDSVCRPRAHSSEISYTPADIHNVVLTPLTTHKNTLPRVDQLDVQTREREPEAWIPGRMCAGIGFKCSPCCFILQLLKQLWNIWFSLCFSTNLLFHCIARNPCLHILIVIFFFLRLSVYNIDCSDSLNGCFFITLLYCV